jgi:ketosteroid isomerase-like protein
MGTVAFDLRTEEVIAADSVAVERGQYVLKFTPGPSATLPAFEDRGNYVTVWQRESDGGLRIKWDAAVSSMPLPVPPPSASVAERPGS